ncbi:hypothetical protein [Pseudomonas paeninsulae]|uniref:hypothetical protein n=1 Tax=Pseudomonas paeninsulae TaxID=3110772 RepID=UPI002D797056|nr:hypothetical protein [Pseudomonas sp. IT1137]
MTAQTWNDLLPTVAQIEAMTPEQLASANMAAHDQEIALGFGIAAVGQILAGAAQNEDHGISMDALTDLGWLLQSLGTLSAKLSDTQRGIADSRKRKGV